jgi:hypothetical protein
MFSYLYYNSYVGAEVGVTVGSVLSSAVQLSRREQLELWGLLANLLAGGFHTRQSVLAPAASEALIQIVVRTAVYDSLMRFRVWQHRFQSAAFFTMACPFHGQPPEDA